jgi:hypothetical protein
MPDDPVQWTNRPPNTAEAELVRRATQAWPVPVDEGRRDAWPLLEWVLPLPAGLAGRAMLAVCFGLERAGLEAFYQREDGLGRLWIRPRVTGDWPTFVCPRCGMTSAHPDDWRQGYCGACHDWTRAPFGGDPK